MFKYLQFKSTVVGDFVETLPEGLRLSLAKLAASPEGGPPLAA